VTHDKSLSSGVYPLTLCLVPSFWPSFPIEETSERCVEHRKFVMDVVELFQESLSPHDDLRLVAPRLVLLRTLA
jgi:hypothetical protein